MQHVIYTEVDSVDPTTLIPVEIDSGGLRSVGSVGSMSLVELGKKLLMGAKDGDTEQVRNLMGKGAPFTTDWLGTSPLHLAAQSGHYDTTEVLLRAGISRDSRTKVERTPLHMAACDGHTEIVQLLLAAGADIDALDMLKMTPLHWAVERGQVDTVQLLLQSGANPRLVNKFDKTPFTIALDNNRHDILQLLQNTDATTTVSGDERTTIHDMEATLAATESISAEKSQVPTPSQQEEVETSSLLNSVTPFVERSSTKQQIFLKSAKFKPIGKVKTIIGKPKIEAVQSANTLQLLKAHGITMLPADDSTLVASAVENGQTVVLTEAGKLALNLTQENIQNLVQNSVPITSPKTTAIPVNKRKVITIRASQLYSMDGQKAPNILKRVDGNRNLSGTFPSNVMLTSARTVSSPALVRNNSVAATSPSSEIASITRELEEARRQAEQYKQLLSKKEQEAEEYKQKLQSIANSK